MRISDWCSDVCSSDLVDGVLVVFFLDHRARMDQLFQTAHQQGASHLKTKDLQAAGGGSRTTADKRQVEKQQQGKAAPQRVVTQRHTCGGNHRCHVDGHDAHRVQPGVVTVQRSEEHTSELQSLMRISYAVFCLKQKKTKKTRQ